MQATLLPLLIVTVSALSGAVAEEYGNVERQQKQLDGSLPELRPDPALRPAIEKALAPDIYSRFLLRDTKDKTLVEMDVKIDQPPVDMAFDVTLQSGNRTWDVGPMAWKKSQGRSWAWNVDLPESVTHVDITFTPSARAGMMMSQFPMYPLQRLTSIWSGDAIIAKNVEIRKQDIRMIRRTAMGDEEAHEHLIDALPPGSEAAKKLANGITLDALRKALEELAAKPAVKPSTWFALGSVLAAQDHLDDAMSALAIARGAPGLEDRLQREKRYICARWFYEANKGRPPAMHALAQAYELGTGVGRDLQQAAYWYRKASNAGHAASISRLATMPSPPIRNGKSAAEDLARFRTQALEWHRQSATTYQEWVSSHANAASGGGGSKRHGKVCMTAVENEREATLTRVHFDSETAWGAELLPDGRVETFHHSWRGSSGGGAVDPLPGERLARIDAVLSRLPDDQNVLPPMNRRLMVQSPGRLPPLNRVYDRADLPDEVHQLARLLGIAVAYVPTFRSEDSVTLRGLELTGCLAVSPQNEIIYTGSQGQLQWWNADTLEFLADADVRYIRGIVFAPDKTHALAEGDGITLIDLITRKPVRTFRHARKPEFTQDGKHLLLSSVSGPSQVISTQSWEPAERPASMPANCTSFIPAPTIARAIVRTVDGTVSLWNQTEHRVVRQLSAKSGENLVAVFSPDESLIAMSKNASRPFGDETPLLFVCRSDTGAIVHVLRPLESLSDDQWVRCLLWSPDGRHLLAGTLQNGGGSWINVFDATTGRHRGILSGPTRMNGIGMLAKTNELIAGDEYGKVWFWNLPVILDHIREFELSLGSEAQLKK